MAVSKVVEICNERGLHARASAKFVKLAASFDAEVTVTRDGTTVGSCFGASLTESFEDRS